MSTEAGGKQEADGMIAGAKSLYETAQHEQEQLELLDPLTPEELAEAREDLGPNAGGLTVMRHAREARRGRPKGAKNKRSDDFARYIAQFGQDPAVTLMQLQSTPEEVHMARSRRVRQKVIGKGESARVVELTEEMTYEAATALRTRCAEALMPFIHSKKPVAIDATIRGVIVQEEIGEVRPVRGAMIDGEILGVAHPADGEDER
ncbi:hypothetical protein [Novosphingobium sp. ST904]|nr:hypothetical protein [Novosphingobium sp. ST904]KPH66339.1 hypothetical protein ADT71_06630 [Novosphingobium sp. ST904]TCM42082.1 hypothetical protein EDF59_10243 [Novosphingobium sp. ST904]